MATSYLVDTNIFLRFLCGDHVVHSPASRKLFADARTGDVDLLVPFTAIAETIFTLRTHYEFGRAEIGGELLKLLTAPGVTLTCPDWVLQAVMDFRDKNVAFGDACIAAEAQAFNVAVASFDRGLAKFPGVKRHEPRP
jgi:predicted nucleic acid-binding protein